MSETYYVRKRGRVTGPFEIDELLKLKDQGRITRVHELSLDQIEWTPAYEVQDVFQAYVELPDERSSYSTANSLKLQGETAAAKSGTEWYYVEDGGRVGPMPLASLRELVTQRVVADDTLVWCDDLSDWSAAIHVPQLAMEFPQKSGRKPSDLADKSVVTASTIFCKACGGRLHATAKNCPTCGAAQRRGNRGFVFLVAMVLLALIVGGAFIAMMVWRQSQVIP